MVSAKALMLLGTEKASDHCQADASTSRAWCYLGGATLKADARSRSFAVLLILRSSRALESGLLKYLWSFSPMAKS